MCGRYYVDIENETMKQLIDRIQVIVPGFALDQMAKGEVFPSQSCLVVKKEETSLPALMTWGYPKWDTKGIIINARTEGILEKSMFRSDILERRCAIVTSGFYEWDKGKTKHLIQGEEDILYLAGVYRYIPDKEHPVFAILTQASRGAMLAIHPREPIILTRKQLATWQSQHFQTLLDA